MKIIIDADGCPVLKICIDIALEHNIKVLVVSDTSHIFSFENENINYVIADKGKDSSDFIILNKCEKNDIVITQDYALASMCLTKKCHIINQNGYLYTDKNIDELLLRRHINKKLRKSSKKDFKIKKRTKEQDFKFAKTLTDIINLYK